MEQQQRSTLRAQDFRRRWKGGVIGGVVGARVAIVKAREEVSGLPWHVDRVPVSRGGCLGMGEVFVQVFAFLFCCYMCCRSLEVRHRAWLRIQDGK